MKRVEGDLIAERASKESIIADRDKLLLEKAALTEKARFAESVNNDTLQAVKNIGGGSMKEVVKQALTEENVLLLDQIKGLFEKRPREDLQELVDQVRMCLL